MDMSLWRTLSHCAGRGLPREAVMRECLLAAACCRLLQYFPMSHRCGDIHLIPHFWYKAPPRAGEVNVVIAVANATDPLMAPCANKPRDNQ